MNEILLPIPLEDSRNIFGQFDIFAKKIERAFQRKFLYEVPFENAKRDFERVFKTIKLDPFAPCVRAAAYNCADGYAGYTEREGGVCVGGSGVKGRRLLRDFFHELYGFFG